MAQQHPWLYIGHSLRMAGVHLVKKRSRIFKTAFVPGEYAPFALPGGISAGKMESIQREALLPHRIHKFQHCVIAVLLQFRIIHAGTLIAQGPLGQQGRPAGQTGIGVQDPGKGLPAQQKTVQITAVRLKIAVSGPVVAFFAAHVKNRLIKIMVKYPHRPPVLPMELDVKRDMFI